MTRKEMEEKVRAAEQARTLAEREAKRAAFDADVQRNIADEATRRLCLCHGLLRLHATLQAMAESSKDAQLVERFMIETHRHALEVYDAILGDEDDDAEDGMGPTEGKLPDGAAEGDRQ